MPAEFGDDPLSVDRRLARMVEDMHLPKAQEDLPAGAMHCLSFITVADVGYHNTSYYYRQIVPGAGPVGPGGSTRQEEGLVSRDRAGSSHGALVLSSMRAVEGSHIQPQETRRTRRETRSSHRKVQR